MTQVFERMGVDLARPCVMGILNITPDSFSDGGFFLGVEKAVDHAMAMIEQGASIIDVGGESTRPGAQAVEAEEEKERVIPVIEAIRAQSKIPISIDTSKPEVMLAAVQAGACLINDVWSLRRPGALQAVSELNVPVCLMHMQGEPRTMQSNPRYRNVVQDVLNFLQKRVEVAMAAGISAAKIILDPGFGFGKSLTHNVALLKNLYRFTELPYPILVGISRKSMLGAIMDAPSDQRLAGSLASAVIAHQKGASIFRVHDVKETVQALSISQAVLDAGS